MKFFRAAFLLLFTSTTIAFAQETPVPAPWPPDPNLIFAAGIEVVDVELFNFFQDPNKPIINSDARAVVMPDGRVFPWPDEIPYARFYVDPDEAINNKLIIFANTEPDAESSTKSATIWQLDSITGRYTKLEGTTIDTICGPRDLHWNSTGWASVNLSSQQLCNMSTGAITTSLPENLLPVRRIESPDGKILLLLLTESDVAESLIVGLYHVPTDTFQLIGKIKTGGYPNFKGWIDNQFAVVNEVINSPEYSRLEVFTLIDVANKEVRQISSSDWVEYRANQPPSIIQGQQRENGLNVSCNFRRYNILARTTLTFTIPAACYPEYITKDYDYYREIWPDETQSTLFRVQRFTGERTNLFSGEIEEIVWVSEDHRYAAVVIDDNGIVDIASGDFRFLGLTEADLTLIDLRTQAILFTTRTYPAVAPSQWSFYVGQVTTDWLQIFDPWGRDTPNQLVHLQEQSIDVFQLNGVIGDYFGNGWATLRPRHVINEFGNVASLDLYNIESQSMIPFVNVAYYYQYYFLEREFKSLGGDQFEIIVGYEDLHSDYRPEKPIARYTIRVPGVDVPAQS